MNQDQVCEELIVGHQVARNATPAEVEAPGTASGYRVLVMEGNDLHRAVLNRMLAYCGFACETVESAAEAVAAFEQSRQDVVLIDCDSPGIDGFAIVSALRQRENLSDRKPMVALTADTSQAARKKRKAAGFDNYIEKPFRLIRLAAILAPYGPEVRTQAGPAWMTLDGGRVSEMCQLAQDEPAFLRELVSRFLTKAQHLLDRMRRAQEEDDAERLLQAAGLLRGISGQVGVVRLQETCAAIQTLAGLKALAGVEALLSEASLALERAGCDLRAMEVDFLARRHTLPGSPHAHRLGPAHILVAEADPLLARFLETSLVAAGFVVTQAVTGRAALSMLREGQFNGAILDAALPEIDGYGLLSALRTEHGLERLPVMFLSPRNIEQDLLRAFELGADDFAAKPFNLLEVVTRMRALLRRT